MIHFRLLKDFPHLAGLHERVEQTRAVAFPASRPTGHAIPQEHRDAYDIASREYFDAEGESVAGLKSLYRSIAETYAASQFTQDQQAERPVSCPTGLGDSPGALATCASAVGLAPSQA